MKRAVTLSLLLASIFQVSAALADDPIPSGQEIQSKAEQNTTIIDTATLRKRLNEEPDLILIDIRTKHEIDRMGGTISVPQNTNIPRGWIEFRIQSLAPEKNTPLVVYCGAGLRSPLAAETLQQMGYTNVRNYSEGYLGWKKSQTQKSE